MIQVGVGSGLVFYGGLSWSPDDSRFAYDLYACDGRYSCWYDAGADGDVDTGDNTLFAVQGLFTP